MRNHTKGGCYEDAHIIRTAVHRSPGDVDDRLRRVGFEHSAATADQSNDFSTNSFAEWGRHATIYRYCYRDNFHSGDVELLGYGMWDDRFDWSIHGSHPDS
jgi:hypothetical protein